MKEALITKFHFGYLVLSTNRDYKTEWVTAHPKEWWVFYDAMMTALTGSSCPAEYPPRAQSVRALRYIFPTLAGKQLQDIPANQRPFFQQTQQLEQSHLEDCELAGKKVNENRSI